jgi:diadenosine tetraphosphate (Ap4A) HIT family hydrolase
MKDCLFCRIVRREIPGSIVYEGDRVLAFNDINPEAPTHVLVIPRKHEPSLNDLTPDDDAIAGENVHRMARINPRTGAIMGALDISPRPTGWGPDTSRAASSWTCRS